MSNTETSGQKPSYPNPFLWVPSSYLAMGLIYVTVGSVANVMFKNMGMDNINAAFWSSILGFPYTFKFVWAPLLELYQTKKFFVVLMQFLIAASIACVAFALKLPALTWVVPVLVLLAISGLARRHAGHRLRRRLCDDAAAEGNGEIHRVSEHVLERGFPDGRRAVDSFQRRVARADRQVGVSRGW